MRFREQNICAPEKNAWSCEWLIQYIIVKIRDGPLEKWRGVGGGGGLGKKKTKKIHVRENAKKKNSCKEEGKENKFMQKEGPIVTFSENLSFRNQQYYQAQYE